jgi:hypothetical protein
MNPAHTGEIEEIDCRTTVFRLWDFLDHELDDIRHAEVDAHVRHCAACAEHFEFARSFLQLISTSWPETGESEQLRARVVHRLYDAGFGQS